MKRFSPITAYIPALMVFVYVTSSLTLSGIPGLSRVAAYSAFVLNVLVFFYALQERIRIGKWVVMPIRFLLLCIITSLLARTVAYDALMSALVAWMGGVAVALLLTSHVSVGVVLYAMVLGSLANAVAIYLGFDAFAAYAPPNVDYSEEALLLRPNGLVANSNLVALQALLPLFALRIWRSHADVFLWAVGSACALYAVFMTGSRKGVVLVGLLMLMLMVTSSIKRRNLPYGLSLGALVGVILLIYLADNRVYIFETGLFNITAISRIQQALEGTDASYIIRSNMIKDGIALISDSPLLGYGLDMFRNLTVYRTWSHNNYIEIGVSGGVLMLAMYYSIHLGILRLCLRNKSGHGYTCKGAALIVLAILFLDTAMVSYDEKIIALLLCMLLSYYQCHSRLKPGLHSVQRTNSELWVHQ